MTSQQIADRIATLCEAKGIKQTHMLEDLGIGTSTVANMRKGSMPSIDKVEAFAHYFGMTIDEFLGISREEALQEVVDMYATRSEMRMLFDLAKGATPEDVIRAAHIIEAIMKEKE